MIVGAGSGSLGIILKNDTASIPQITYCNNAIKLVATVKLVKLNEVPKTRIAHNTLTAAMIAATASTALDVNSKNGTLVFSASSFRERIKNITNATAATPPIIGCETATKSDVKDVSATAATVLMGLGFADGMLKLKIIMPMIAPTTAAVAMKAIAP